MNYCTPEIPKVYWINSIIYKCNNCQYEFEFLAANGNELVKYQEVNGNKIRWLPVYGKGGYLDLMCKLIPEFSPDREITMEIAKKFNVLLQKYIEPSASGNTFTLADYNRYCPKCNSKDLTEINGNVLTNPNVEWLKISCDLIK